jgi:exopolyphosphatase / guanosine-5'-triphosphate,3'-diphosphate pyrophosphatase
VSERLALLEFGSNAARFVVARIVPGVAFRVVREERVPTRLAAGRALLPRPAVSRAVDAAHRFLRSLPAAKPHRVLAVATSAVRDAANANALLGRLRDVAGIEVEILSGHEEARLGAASALASLPLEDATLADLGGGSLELTLVDHGRITPFASLAVGAVRLTARFIASDPPGPAELQALRRHVRARLGRAFSRVRGARRHAPLVGLGGTVRALARIHLETARRRRTAVHGTRLRRADVEEIRQRLQNLTLAQRRRVRGLKAERADIIVAGAMVVEEIMSLGGHEDLTVCDRGVRHGLLLRETFGRRL